MTLRSFALVAVLALGALHCQSEGKKADADTVEENHPGSILITKPERGAFIEEGKSVHVRGTGATQALTINGKPVQVAGDGSFDADITPEPGLNLAIAVDGASRVETPFMYGHFERDQPIPRALAIDIGADGLGAPLPTASISSVVNAALENRDLLAMLNGKDFSGDSPVAFKFHVNKASNGPIRIDLSPATAALAVEASVETLLVDGRLEITKFGATVARDVRLTMDRGRVFGNVELGLDEEKGALKAAMAEPGAQLDGFKIDSDNLGVFPCCVDSILSGFVKGKIQDTIRDQIREQLPKVVGVTLEGVGVPKQLDLAVAKLPTKVPITTKFDSAFVDAKGGSISASALFAGNFAPDAPGAKAPGSLILGGASDPDKRLRADSVGVTISLDALNQLFYAAWGTGAAVLTLPEPFAAKLTPTMPPVLSITDNDALRIALGELVVQRAGSKTPLAAATVRQDVKLKADGDALVIAGDGPATISITWLADEGNGSGANLIANTAKEMLGKYLKGYRLPMPAIGLDRLGGALVGRSLVIEKPMIVLDKASARVTAAGNLKISTPAK